jgi:hypothetical protein
MRVFGRLLLVSVLLLLAFTLASCGTLIVKKDAAPAETKVEGVKAASQDVVNGMFDINGIDVKSYRIRGEGPDGAYFDWIPVTSSRVALSDIRRGEWTIYAEGLDANGNVIVTGKIDTFLSENTPVDNLVLTSNGGKGNVKCDIMWNTSQVRNPSVEVFVKPLDGEYSYRSASELAWIENGHMVWSAEKLTSGSYVARFILKDGSTVVSGAAAALRVVQDKVSVGDVKMTIGDLSTVYGITIENLPENTIKGSLVLTDGIANFETPLDKKNFTFVWFVDGNEAAQESGSLDLYSLNLTKGYHRVDVVVMSSSETSINSSSLIVYVNPELAKDAKSDQDPSQWLEELEGLGLEEIPGVVQQETPAAVPENTESEKQSAANVVNVIPDEVEGEDAIVFANN